MFSEPSRLLTEDHHGVDRVFQKLETSLEAEDVESVEFRLDLIWARLAVHIRAEHLHLFPIVLMVLPERESSDERLPSAVTAQTTIAQLHEDHDFFMHELANAVALVREIRKVRDDDTTVVPDLKEVTRIVGEVKQRLAEHNRTEESQVYRWLLLLLEPADLADLASRINAELDKRPPRFTDAAWTE